MYQLNRLSNKIFIITLAWALSGGILMAANAQDSVNQVLNRFHQAATEHNFEAYFSTMSPDAVFIGTDATERWSLEAFKAYVKPHFAAGRGWTYKSRERHISIGTGESIAWFDELLDNAKYGTCRGSGVLVKQGSDWRISQYHLTIPVPNELVDTLVKLIQEPAKNPSKK